MTSFLSLISSAGTVFSKDLGILILRIGVGALFFHYGFEHLKKGKTEWEWMGSQLASFGITFTPTLWGFFASLIQTCGGLLCIIGLKMRVAALLIACIMLVAIDVHKKKETKTNAIALPITLFITLISLSISGSGRFSLDYLISKMWC